jgi:glycosyltransferase involved in cell wall biosynthesis
LLPNDAADYTQKRVEQKANQPADSINHGLGMTRTSLPKVIFVAGRDPIEVLAGDTSYARAHAHAALNAGFLPHLFCPSDRTETIETNFGVLHRVASPFRPFRYPILPGHGPLIIREMKKFLRSEPGPHLIHGIGIWGQSGVALTRWLRRRGQAATYLISSYTTMESEIYGKVRGLGKAHTWRQHYLHWIEYAWVKSVINLYERQSFYAADRITFNYDSVRQLIIDQHRAEFRFRKMAYSSEAAYIHADAQKLPMPPAIAALKSPEAPLIVSVSRHDPRKGLDVLIRALAILRAEGKSFRACLLGGGVLFDAHRRLAEKLYLTGIVALTNWVDDPFPYLQHADIFVLPSIQEGSGSVSLLEAMQVGVAAVASDIDGLPEDVTDGESALLVPSGDPQALSRAIARLLHDPDLRARLGQRGHEIFIARFSAEAFTNDLRSVYTELGFNAQPSEGS